MIASLEIQYLYKNVNSRLYKNTKDITCV